MDHKQAAENYLAFIDKKDQVKRIKLKQDQKLKAKLQQIILKSKKKKKQLLVRF